MSELLLVRHGQASFMSDNYDRLSDLGILQAEALGSRWVNDGVRPTHLFAGTLQRQQRSAQGVRHAFAAAGISLPSVQTLPGLDEYPAEVLVESLAPRAAKSHPEVKRWIDAVAKADDKTSQYRAVHRLLEAAMTVWVNDECDLEGLMMPSWAAFSAGVRDALQQARVADSGAVVAVFTSGGPVGIAVQTALNSPALTAASLNWRVRNASVTRFTYSGPRISLDSFNDVSHLGANQLTYR
ncbi:MAG: histidine phosphatase family protein [Pseudomonadota bacterium]